MPSPSEVIPYLSGQTPTNLFKILNKLPRFGIGRKLTRDVWELSETGYKAVPNYWTIKRVVPTLDLKSGQVYGVFSLRGKPEAKTRKIACDLKTQWKLLPRDF